MPTLPLVVALCAAMVTVLATPPTAQAQDGQTGYVDTTALNLRAGAGTSSAIVGILLKYDTVTVYGTEQVGKTNWYAIEAGGGYTNGYVAARYIQFGDPPDNLPARVAQRPGGA